MSITREELHDAITDHGGLLGQGQIATLLGVSREMARRHTNSPGFPRPFVRVTIPGGRDVPLWLGADVDTWQRRRVERLKKRRQRRTPTSRMRGPR